MGTALALDIKRIIEQELRKETRKIKSNPQILIVEDDLTTEPLWEHIIRLASPNASFDWATSALEAEQNIEDLAQKGLYYDLVISDIFLEGEKSGVDLWKDYQGPLKGRMIIISSIDQKQFAEYCGDIKNLPIYIRKPLQVGDCIETVYNILQEK